MNNSTYFWAPMVVVVHRVDCILFKSFKMDLNFWSCQPIEGLGFSWGRRADHDVEKRRPILDGQGTPKGRLDLINRGTEVALKAKHLHHFLVVNGGKEWGWRTIKIRVFVTRHFIWIQLKDVVKKLCYSNADFLAKWSWPTQLTSGSLFC